MLKSSYHLIWNYLVMTIQDVIERRNVKFLVHFTRLENLDNILKNGLIPRAILDKQEINYHYNDQYRYDNKTDYSCLSVGFPNDLMFYKLRCDDPSVDWSIIVISTKVLLDYNCLFYPCNSASSDVSHQDVSNYQGAEAFDAMFQNDLNYPQNVQAEVMVKGVISPKYIKGCIFDKKKYIDEYGKKFNNLKLFYRSPNSSFFIKRMWTSIGY